ncbi:MULTISPECIES: hypothetical protein [unclassified Nocardiopsis]|uniref:hypothetical protein n=1 Tax=unclassified Nocardiopsis TaxID=2649073 RepID=UPI001359CE34|nr:MULTISPECIES: hypothetical protein [unclassified Nocardiopsis]
MDNITELSMDPDDIHVVEGDDDGIDIRDRVDLTDEHFGEPLDNDEFFENPDDPGERLGPYLDPEEHTGHSGYFDDEQTLGDVATGSRRTVMPSSGENTREHARGPTVSRGDGTAIRLLRRVWEPDALRGRTVVRGTGSLQER